MHTDHDAAPTADRYACLDWHGNRISCSSCDHASLQSQGGCIPGAACVRDRYSRRIHAFFERNPELADDYLDHPYFEVRTLATKHVSVFKLTPLLDDPEPEVRVAAAQRLPVKRILSLRSDSERKVRAAVAQRLTGADLVPMVTDNDYYVRVITARRLPVDILPLMMYDPDADVRKMVARRIGEEWLAAMAWDESPEVRLEIAGRLSPDQLVALIDDEDWRVRHAVACHAPLTMIAPLLDDHDQDVRMAAQERLEQGEDAQPQALQSYPPAPSLRMAGQQGFAAMAARPQTISGVSGQVAPAQLASVITLNPQGGE